MAVSDGCAVARRAAAVRELEHDLQELQPMGEEGVWARLLEKVQSLTQQRGELDWVTIVDRLDDRARASAWRDAVPRHRGSIELQEVRSRTA